MENAGELNRSGVVREGWKVVMLVIHVGLLRSSIRRKVCALEKKNPSHVGQVVVDGC